MTRDRKKPWPIGRTIVRVRELDRSELQSEGWDTNAFVTRIELDDGTVIYAASDPAGSAPGALCARTRAGHRRHIYPVYEKETDQEAYPGPQDEMQHDP